MSTVTVPDWVITHAKAIQATLDGSDLLMGDPIEKALEIIAFLSTREVNE